MGPLEVAAVLLIAALGATLQGTVGFGMAMVAAPLLALVDPRLVPGPLILGAMSLTLMITIRERREVSLRRLGWALIGRVPGSLAGAYAVTRLTRDDLSLMLGVLVLLAVVASAFGAKVAVTRTSLMVAGAGSGFMGTSTSVGGPPMALLYQHEDGASMRGNLNGFFLVGTIISLTLLTAAGEFGAQEIRLAGALVPGMAAGFALSFLTKHRLDAARLRPMALALSGIAAGILVVRTLLAG